MQTNTNGQPPQPPQPPCIRCGKPVEPPQLDAHQATLREYAQAGELVPPYDARPRCSSCAAAEDRHQALMALRYLLGALPEVYPEDMWWDERGRGVIGLDPDDDVARVARLCGEMATAGLGEWAVQSVPGGGKCDPNQGWVSAWVLEGPAGTAADLAAVGRLRKWAGRRLERLEAAGEAVGQEEKWG
jgi:hypothetical protein